MTELNWSDFDRQIEAYAVLCAYSDRHGQIESEIVKTCENLARAEPVMGDFTYMLNRQPTVKDEVQRKIAWTSQHIFGSRAWSVGQKILFERRNKSSLESPLVNQLKALGYAAQNVDLRSLRDSWKRDVREQDRLDVMLVNSKEGRVILVKGLSISQARVANPNIFSTGLSPTLFNQAGNLFMGVRAKKAALASLAFSRDMLRAAFPDLKIECHFLVVDDPDCGWRFQASDVTEIDIASIGSMCRLDDFRVSATFHDFASIFEQDSDAFSQMPKWSVADFIKRCPVDRPTRCIMVLREMWARQESQPQKLLRFSPSTIAEAVSNEHHIEYPVDLYRHDFEDCLERGQFVGRWGAENKFVIFPKGLARLLMISHKFNRHAYVTSSEILTKVSDLAKLKAATSVL